MSLINYYQYLGEGRIRPVDIDTIKGLTNPGAICTVEKHMVINPYDLSFTMKEVREIIEYIQTKIKKDENKSTDSSSTPGV